MARESIFCTIALTMILFALPPQSSGQAVAGSAASGAAAFHTGRLSPRQIKLWNAIRKIVLAPDSQGRPLHPTLYGLWRSVEQSGHRVHVELITDKQRSSNVAGECLVEEFDAAGRLHTFRLRLFIPTIDRVYAAEQAPQEGMTFVPFSGLTHRERYAKVLGHELAHIVNMLSDTEYLRLLREICVEQNAIAARVGTDGKRSSEADLRERSNLVWRLVLESERPALSTESRIYYELLRK